MHKMMKSTGIMVALGMVGVGTYMLMNKKMPISKMKKTLNSPYTMDSQKQSVKSN